MAGWSLSTTGPVARAGSSRQISRKWGQFIRSSGPVRPVLLAARERSDCFRVLTGGGGRSARRPVLVRHLGEEDR